MKVPVGVGVIGTGYWGRKLVEEYLLNERNKGKLKLVKVCDSALPALLSCKEKFSLKGSLLTQKVEDLIEDPKISAVHIATPNHTHYPLAKMALEAGKAVLLEKPMTLISRQAYELVELATSRELVLQVGHIFRFNSALSAARKALELGVIGKIFYVRVQWTDYCPPYSDRDIIFDLGPHPIDVLNQILGAWPTQASAIGRAYRNSKESDEVAYVLAEFQDDVFAHIELSWLHPSKVREVSIVGTYGALVVDCLNQRVVRYSNGNRDEYPVRANNTIEAEIDHFIDCVSRRVCSIESGLIGAQTVEVLEAISESMWERPLPIVKQYRTDNMAAMTALLEMTRQRICDLGSLLRQDGLANGRTPGNAKLRKYVGILLGSGLLRSVETEDGIGYEITDRGSRFLREYKEVEQNLGLGEVKTRKTREGLS